MKKCLTRFGLSIMSVLFTIVILEIGLRLFAVNPYKVEAPLNFDPDYGWQWQPNTEGRLTDLHGEMNIPYKINHDGFYDHDHEMKKPEGRKRIVFLGDSLTEGRQVLLKETFARRIQSAINGSTVDTWESFNCGIKGYNTTQAFHLYRKVVHSYDPDIVVLGFTEGDLVDNHPKLTGIWYAPTYKFENDQLVFHPLDMAMVGSKIYNYDSGDPEKRISGFLRKTYFWTYKREFGVRLRTMLREKSLKRKKQAVPPGWEIFLKEYSDTYKPYYAEAERVTQSLFRMFHDKVLEDGAKFLVMIIPSRMQIYEHSLELAERQYEGFNRENLDLNRNTRTLIAMLEKENVPYLSLLEALQARSKETQELLYYTYDGHLTGAGHDAVTDALAVELSRRQWTP